MNKQNKAGISLKKIIIISLIILFITGLSVMAGSAKIKTVKIILSSNYEMSVVTDKKKVGEILEENHIILTQEEKVSPSIDEELSENKTIRISKNEQDLKIAEAENTNITVEELLNQNYNSITEKIETKQEEIPFETITKDVSTGASKQNKIVQEGENGLKEITYKIKYQNDVEIEKIEISSKIIKEPKNKIIEIQTQKVTSRSNVSRTEEKQQTGETVKTGTYVVTAYCSCSKCCGKATGRTASGTQATAGRTVAAPSNFAFGTKLKINGKVYVVEDRGGAIKGNRIDIYMSNHTQALAWGRRTCTVEVLK